VFLLSSTSYARHLTVLEAVRFALKACRIDTMRGIVVADASCRSTHAMRVLIIDDDRDSADGLASLLTAAGHDVHVVVGAREGLDAVETWSPDVALLDIGLPDNGAYLVARRLRASVSSRPVRLVALTEWGQKEDRRRSATAGFAHHLVKPVDPLHLRVLLDSVASLPLAAAEDAAKR
jgi:CheY-like chemotaxis protein